jgi:selenocysteine lyase/cysteine desulfurase
MRDEKALLERLGKSKVLVALRYVSGVGGIRTAVHESNTEADVDALLEVVKRFVRRGKT